jgi:hypothetical protein
MPTGVDAIPCSQSQIDQDRYLRKRLTTQVEGAIALSVIVRWGPLRTAVNGTPVARPLRTTPSDPSCLRFYPDCRVRPVLGDNRLVGKSLEGSRQRVGRLELHVAGLGPPRSGGCRCSDLRF